MASEADSSTEEAAAVADIYQLALHGAAVKPHHLKYPADAYSSKQITAARQALQAKYPELITAIGAAGRRRLHPT